MTDERFACISIGPNVKPVTFTVSKHGYTDDVVGAAFSGPYWQRFVDDNNFVTGQTMVLCYVGGRSFSGIILDKNENDIKQLVAPPKVVLYDVIGTTHESGECVIHFNETY